MVRKDYKIALQEKHLLKVGFNSTDNPLVFEAVNRYKTVYKIVYEGYAWVLYQIYDDKYVPIQDFRDKTEFLKFWKVLFRDSVMENEYY